MSTRSILLLLAAILSMSMMAFTTATTTTSAQQGGIHAPMPASLSSSSSGSGGGGDGGVDDDDDNNGNASRPTINVTSINSTTTLALDDLEELLTLLETNANITRRSIITDLEGIKLAFQNIQGNLSGIIPAIQDEADIR